MQRSVQFRRLIAAACLVLAPALIVVAFAIAPFGSDENGKEIFQIVTANVSTYTAVPVILTAAVLLMIPAFLATIRLTAERAPYLAYVGGGIGIAGFVALLPTFMVEQTALALARAGVPAATAASVIDRLNGDSLVLGILTGIFVAGHVLGVTILGAALIRARVVPIWAGAAVAVSQPLHLVAHIVESKPLDLFAFSLLALGLWVIAAAAWRRPAMWLSSAADEWSLRAAGEATPA